MSPILDIQVINSHHESGGEYIGRGSPLGNPWPIKGTDTREIVIARYKVYLRQQIEKGHPTIIAELERLAELAMQGPLKLSCFCAPEACHGDIVKETLINAIQENFPQYK